MARAHTDAEAEQLLSAAREIIKPSYDGDPVAWLERNVTDVPDSPIRGQLNLGRTPWVAEAIRVAVDAETRLLSIQACTQAGKSLFLRLFTCHQIVTAPQPMMILQMTDPEAKDFMLRYVRPLWEKCAPVKALLSDGDNDKSQVADFKNGTTIYCRGGWNEKNLQRLTLRTVLIDEAWQLPRGHIGEAAARTTSFDWMSKVIVMGQAGVLGDEASTLHLSTDQRAWHFACVECGAVQPWLWEQVRFPDSAKVNGVWDTRAVEEGTTYECQHCNARMPDKPGTRAMANDPARGACFKPTATASSFGAVGLHWNCLCNSSWGKEGAALIKAKEAYDLYGDSSARKTWKTKRLAQPWTEDGGEMVAQAQAGDYALGDAWDKEALINPDAKVIDPTVNEVPAGCIKFRTMAVDVQRAGHFWVEVRSWAKSGHSRLRWWGKVETWQQLDDLAKQHEIHKALIGVDCGDQTQLVNSHCASRGWKALRGSGQDSFTVQDSFNKTSKRFYSDKQMIFIPGIAQRCEMIVWGNLPTKDLLVGLQKRRLHTFARNVPGDYVEQLTSEVRVTDSRSGKPHWILPAGKTCGNHAWDCALMGLILAVRWGIIGKESIEAPADAQPPAN